MPRPIPLFLCLGPDLRPSQRLAPGVVGSVAAAFASASAAIPVSVRSRFLPAVLRSWKHQIGPELGFLCVAVARRRPYRSGLEEREVTSPRLQNESLTRVRFLYRCLKTLWRPRAALYAPRGRVTFLRACHHRSSQVGTTSHHLRVVRTAVLLTLSDGSICGLEFPNSFPRASHCI